MSRWVKNWMNDSLDHNDLEMYERMTEWTNEWMNEWTNEWIQKWMNHWMKQMNVWINECMNEFMYAWINEWVPTPIQKHQFYLSNLWCGKGGWGWLRRYATHRTWLSLCINTKKQYKNFLKPGLSRPSEI